MTSTLARWSTWNSSKDHEISKQMGYRRLRSYKYDRDLEILTYPHTVLVKVLVDDNHLQLVSGSGEEQNQINEPEGAL